MRPSPADVRAWFVAPLSCAAVHGYLTRLRRDPNWLVLYQPHLPLNGLTLHYGPTGERLYLERIGRVEHALWRCVPSIYT